MYFIKIKIDFKKVCAQAMFFLLISCTVSDVLLFFVLFFPRKLSMIKVHIPLCLDLINVVKTRRYNLTYYWTCEWILANQAFINLCHLPWYWQKRPAFLTKGIEGTLLTSIVVLWNKINQGQWLTGSWKVSFPLLPWFKHLMLFDILFPCYMQDACFIWPQWRDE